MPYRIIYTNEAGGVSIVIPAEGMQIEKLVATVIPSGVEFEVIETSAIPIDRTFRDAWEKSGPTIVHNILKAKNIAHEKRRLARAAEFAPLDIEVTIPAKAAAAEAKRQEIRDRYAAVQASIDSANDITALKGIVATF